MSKKDLSINNSFNEEFCDYLEYHLGDTFLNSGREDVKGFWCDGVSWFPHDEAQLTKKKINDTKKLITQAWIGKTGQDIYQMTIHFGKYSLRRCAKGKPIIDCIPASDNMEWVEIDISKKTIEIRLK